MMWRATPQLCRPLTAGPRLADYLLRSAPSLSLSLTLSPGRVKDELAKVRVIHSWGRALLREKLGGQSVTLSPHEGKVEACYSSAWPRPRRRQRKKKVQIQERTRMTKCAVVFHIEGKQREGKRRRFYSLNVVYFLFSFEVYRQRELFCRSMKKKSESNFSTIRLLFGGKPCDKKHVTCNLLVKPQNCHAITWNYHNIWSKISCIISKRGEITLFHDNSFSTWKKSQSNTTFSCYNVQIITEKRIIIT